MPEEPEIWSARTPWWRTWRLNVLLAAALFLSAPLVLRAVRVAQVGDVPEPFDLAAASHVAVGPGENAYEHYDRALALMGSARIRSPQQTRDALEAFVAGSQLPNAVYHQPGTITVNTLLPVTQGLRDLTRMAQAEALRLELEGDREGAWQLHLAAFRASRHSGMHGALIERLIGVAIHSSAADGIASWAANPANDATALRQSLAEIRSAYRMTAPFSETLKVEYLFMTKQLDDPQLMGWSTSVSGFFNAEPAVSRSVLKRVYANYLSECDNPRAERRALTPGQVPLFQLDPLDSNSASQIEPLLQKAVLARLVLPAIQSGFQAHDRERARQALLELTLVLQIWYRQHGSFPAEAEMLVGKDLEKLPIDPFGKGEPIHYRLESSAEEGATIWSIGPDGVNDDGRIKFVGAGSQTGDLVVEIIPPAPKKSSN